MRTVLRYSAAWLSGALPAFLIITLLWLYPGRTTPFAYIAVGAFALAFPVMVRRLGVPRRVEFVYFLLAAGVTFAIISVLTGWGNGLTDEPFTTPRFAAFTLAGHDPYTTQLVFTYQQYGKTLSSQSYYLYLPLLMFLQVPGTDYKWFAVGCWAVMVLLARRRFDTATLLAQPYVMLLAASGYNDLPVLLLLTLGFVGVEGRRQKWAEYLSLGCKQFANAFVVVYYLVQRRWRDTLITLVVSAAFLAPFFVWSGPAIICPAVFADRLSSCSGGSSAQLLLNYPVWAVWVVAVFYLPVGVLARTWAARPRVAGTFARGGVDPTRFAGLPALVVVGASAAAVGLCVFVAAGLVLGTTALGTVGSGAAAVAAAFLWSWGWNGPSRFAGQGTLGPTPEGRRAACQLAIALALPTLALWVGLGRGGLEGMTVGLGLGVFVSSTLLALGDLGRGPAALRAAVPP